MLSGELVFAGIDPLQMIIDHLNREPVRLSGRTELAIPAPLEELVLECPAKNPDQRAQSTTELSERLQGLALEQSWTPEQA